MHEAHEAHEAWRPVPCKTSATMTNDLDATELLDAVRSGSLDARDRLFALLYGELRRCAHLQLRGAGHSTLSTTALVNEAYLKLCNASRLNPESRRHFLSIASQAMRQLLVDRARRAATDKRGGGDLQVTLSDEFSAVVTDRLDVLALDRALGVLEQVDERAARVVQLHFFGGLNFSEIATLEALSERTIKRDWQTARLMLVGEMRHDAGI